MTMTKAELAHFTPDRAAAMLSLFEGAGNTKSFMAALRSQAAKAKCFGCGDKLVLGDVDATGRNLCPDCNDDAGLENSCLDGNCGGHCKFCS